MSNKQTHSNDEAYRAAINTILAANRVVYNADQAADYLGLAKSYLYKLTCNGVLSFSKPGGKKMYFSREDLDKYLLSNKSKSNLELDAIAETYIATHQ